ncbi:MAG: T9SS type A sorting domain-containing protein, partial [Candidatus Delongbacteria bacterium]|nr:T9SS type A sorting domain-containing protein [Candidatus Delongbacteria bacterium]
TGGGGVLLGYEDYTGINGLPVQLSTPSSIEGNNVPAETKLHQNYPNPFNPNTTIKFDLASNSNVRLSVYNYNGQMVQSLVDGQMNAGVHTVNFDASNLCAGVYFYALEANNSVFTNKMILVK